MTQQKQKGGSSRKVGRNKRPVNKNLSNYVKGIITFARYEKGQ